jgi:hypothetical protein
MKSKDELKVWHSFERKIKAKQYITLFLLASAAMLLAIVIVGIAIEITL